MASHTTFSSSYTKTLQATYTTCPMHAYSKATTPHYFRVATTIALHKPAKPDYKELKAWCPFTLLNTLGKALEAIITRRICYIAEHYNPLPQVQHGYCWQRNTIMALELLTEQVHTV